MIVVTTARVSYDWKTNKDGYFWETAHIIRLFGRSLSWIHSTAGLTMVSYAVCLDWNLKVRFVVARYGRFDDS